MQPKEIPAIAFLRDKVPEILKKECGNVCSIHLYRCGQYWMALEQSAYLIYEIFHYTGRPSVVYLTNGNRFVMIEEPEIIVQCLRNNEGCKEATNEYVKYDTSHLIVNADFETWKKGIN